MKDKPSERRWSPRRDMRVEVTLSGNELRTQEGVCHNIGVGGLYVQTDPTGLVIDRVYHVSFTLGQGNGLERYRFAARVIRLASDGSAMMFTEFPLGTLRGLRRLLYEEVPERSPRHAPGAEHSSNGGSPRSSFAEGRRRHND